MTQAFCPADLATDSAERAIANRLVADLGVEEQEVANWILHALTCFPVPTARQAPCLFGAFLRLIRVVPWVRELLPADGFLEPLRRVGPKIQQLVLSQPQTYGGNSDELLRRAFHGDFRLAGTLHGGYSGLPLPSGSEALRTILLWCRWTWWSVEHPRIAAVEDLAHTIRGDGQWSVEPRTLLRMGQAKTLQELVTAAAALKMSPHENLAKVWRWYVEPELLVLSQPLSRS